MKVVHCVSNFMPTHTAGTEVYAWALCKGLIDNDIESYIVIPNYGSHITEQYEYENVIVYKFSEPSVVDRELIMGLRKPDGLFSFVELIKSINPDLVHFHELSNSNGYSIQHVRAINSLNIQIVMTFHLAGYSCRAGTLMYKNKILCDGIIDEIRCTECMINNYTHNEKLTEILIFFAKKLYQYDKNLYGKKFKLATALSFPFIINKLRLELFELISICNKVIVLTDWYYKILKENLLDTNKLILIKQGLINNKFERNLTGVINQNNSLRFIFLGRLNHLKGLHLILDAMAKIDSDKYTLDVYGSDPNDEYSENCKQRIANNNSIKWKGSLKPTEVLKVMQNYDILILASTFSEMSPLVIQEAFAVGIPVLASNVYGNAEQITDSKNGWLFKFNDANDLKEKMQFLIQNPQKVHEVKSNVITGKDFKSVVDEHIALYKRTIKEL